MDSREFLRLALDPVRLTLLGRAAEGSLDPGEVASRHGVTERSVLASLGRLRAAGLVDEDFRLDRSALRELAVGLTEDVPLDPRIVGEIWDADEEKILRTFFSGDRLASIPASNSKRRVVLERLAQEFEPGTRYEERSVNEIILRFHEDYAALRRYMVEEDLLTREGGVYWRSGGRFQPDAL